MTMPPEMLADFVDLLGGPADEIRAHQEKIYRKVESDLIVVWKELQRIQSSIMAEIAKQIPPHHNDRL